ncbi:DUF2771 family protein [Corynebacterium lujinxingii]|uniref:DUF2771 domain-containing protein n=1 Tax=Corynebacterium lujinxingii TaxID=2763010 RepID=A0A7H0K0C6_9CORY|nr:DUF2771 family protein [Corynebacterium lujinxingii]MBC3179523.1 DUF2771 domain-containing protein [Corynebacterium lujinxingii]NNO11752.1 DUF2771 family protein [Corynebacterium lujinxingii]QNP90742.1 DUF2771 domain-containing protein [Corynebacterium lujinxingii]
MAQSRQWKTLVVALVGVVVLVGAVYAFLEWQNNRPATPVDELTVSVTANGETQDIGVYTVCELDEECPGGDAPTMQLGEDDVTVALPDEIARNSWRLLLVYDDPDANEERVFTSGESASESAPAVTASGAKLVVAEVTTLDIKEGDDGEETPVIATWSVGFN